MRLDPVSLRLFVAVMEEQAIARAAAREHIATSAASRRLSELEVQLQVRLFERSNRGITPTAAAYTLLDLDHRPSEQAIETIRNLEGVYRVRVIR